MPANYKYLSIFLGLVFSLSSLSVKAQKTLASSDFKTLKKGMDSISILQALVETQAIDLGGVIREDTTEYVATRNKMEKKAFEVLQEKYVLKNMKIVNEVLNNEIYQIISQLEKRKSDIELVSLSDSSLSSIRDSSSTYCLINVYNKIYKTQARIKEEEKQLRKISIPVAILTLGSVYITPENTNFTSAMSILVDTKTGKVIYYKRTSNGGCEQLIYQNLMKLYYK